MPPRAVTPQPPRRRIADAGFDALAAGFETLTKRVDAIERRDIEADLTHRRLEERDSETASAVRDLTRSINDPRQGLIIELDHFRSEVRNDRRVFKAWIAGAVAVLSAILTVGNIYAPAIRSILGIHAGP
jgi:hypothetical protein